MNNNFIDNLNKIEIIKSIIDNIYEEGGKILYNKYIETKISDYIGNFYSENLIIPVNHLLFECDRGENKQDLKNWVNEPFPLENKIDNWACYRLKVKKNDIEINRNKVNRKLTIRSNFSDIKKSNTKNTIINNSEWVYEDDFEFKDTKVVKTKKDLKKQKTILNNEKNIRINKENQNNKKKEELSYLNRKKEEEDYKNKKKKEIENKINKKDFIYDDKGNLVFFKQKVYEDLPISELNEVKYIINKEKRLKTNEYEHDNVVKTLNFQEVENIHNKVNRLQILTPIEEIEEYKNKVNKIPIVNEILEIEKGVTYKVAKRIIKKGENVKSDNLKNMYSKQQYKALVVKNNNLSNVNWKNITTGNEDNKKDRISIKDSLWKKSINSLKEELEKGLKGVLFINPNLLINFLKEMDCINSIKDEERIKRKLKRKENKAIFDKFYKIFNKKPEKFLNRIVIFQNDILKDKNFNKLPSQNKIAFTKFQKQLLSFNKDIINDKNRINNSYIDPARRELLNKPKIPINRIRQSSNYRIRNTNTITQSYWYTKGNNQSKNFNIDKSNLVNYFNNYSVIK